MRDKEADLSKLADAFFDNLIFDNGCEYGSIGTDPKRPFGNSDVEGDVVEIIGAKPEGDDGEDECWSRAQREYASALYSDELIPYLGKQWRHLKVGGAAS